MTTITDVDRLVTLEQHLRRVAEKAYETYMLAEDQAHVVLDLIVAAQRRAES